MRLRSVLYWCSLGLLLLIPLIAFGDVIIAPGDSVSGIWRAEDGIVYCMGDAIVPADSTLIIEPNVHVVFESDGTFLVYGKLIADGGTPSDSIFFKGPSDPVWLGIWFENSCDPECLLNYVSIENSFYGVRARHCTATVRNTSISSNSVGIDAAYAYITIEGCIINVIEGQGDGIKLYDSGADIRNSFITVINEDSPNTADGIYAEYSDPDVFYTIITVDSKSQARGIYLRFGDKTRLQYNLIDVTSEDQAYGIYLNDCTYPDIINQTIVVDSPLETDQGIHLLNNSNPNILNTIIYGDGNSVGIKAEEGSEPEITYCDVYNHRINLVNCSFGTGCISEDPLFEEGSLYELTPNSPCIDAGSPESPQDPDFTRADMGYMYFHQWPPAVEDSPGGIPQTVGLLQVYPNPFNSRSRIFLNLPEPQIGSLVIYDARGRKVTVIRRGRFAPGSIGFEWQSAGAASGTYWVVFRSNRFEIVQKLVLVK